MQKKQEEWVTPQEQTCADIVIKKRILRVPSYLTGLVDGHATWVLKWSKLKKNTHLFC